MGEITVIKFIDPNGTVWGVNQDSGDMVTIAKVMGYTGATLQFPRLDPSTFAMESIEYAHHEIHGGNSFEYTNALDFGNGETKSFLFTVPNTTKWVHFFFTVSGELEYNVDFYEGATPDTIGSVVSAPAVINKDRNSLVAAGMVITSPTLGGGSKGTLIRRHHAGSGKKAGGENRGENEIILKQNTKYWADITNVPASNNFIGLALVWYEHTNKE